MATPTPDPCTVCQHKPESRNNAVSECSHPECPHRRKCWSERPGAYRQRSALYADDTPTPERRNPLERALDRVKD